MDRDRERVDSEGSGRGSGRNTPRDYDEPRRPDTPGPMPKYRYTRERLLELKSSPVSQVKPACLSNDFFTVENVWDPEKWVRSFDGSRSNSPMTSNDFRERKRSIELERESVFRRGNGFTQDPRERLKEEKDGIVLSPQRRSFGTGCHVSISRQISCPAEFNNGPERDRDRRDQRRIGSGRIQIERDRDKPRERDYRSPHDRYEREDRSYGRDRFRRDHDDRRDYRDNGYNRMNRRNHKEEEPEWFTGGPTSQHDTIELRGFDKPESEPEELTEKEEKPVQNEVAEGEISVADRNGSLETNESSSPEESNHSENGSPGQAPPASSLFDFNEFFKIENIQELKDDELAETEPLASGRSRFTSWFKVSGSQGNSHENSRRSSMNEDFAYLQDLVSGTRSPLIPSPQPHTANNVFQENSPLFFTNNQHMEHPPLSSEVYSQQKAPGFQNSRFPDKQKNNANFSTRDAEAQLKALLFGRKDSTASSSGTASPVVNSPFNVFGRVKTLAELEAGLQPQSPMQPPPQRTPSPPSLQNRPPPIQQIHPIQFSTGVNFNAGHSPIQVSGQMPGMPPQSLHQPPIHHQTPLQPMMPNRGEEDGDLTAFNKLLSLMKAGAASESPKMPVMRADLRAPSPPLIMNSKMAQNEFFQALQRNKEQQLHIQMQTLQSLHSFQDLNPQLHKPPPPPPPQGDPILNFIKQNPTIITKPASPTPPPQHPMMGSMQNTTSTPRAMSPSLPIIQQQSLLPQQPQPPQSPRIASPLMFSQQPPVHLSAPSPIHPGNLSRSSPVPTSNSLNPPTSPRVPTPQELVAHTQAIMQNALIKRQLEEQKERFIRKQQERGKSPPLTQGHCKSPVMFVNQMQTPQGKPSVSAAFTPTSVIKKMHSEKAERDRQRSEGHTGDSGSPETPSPELNHSKLEDDKEHAELRARLSSEEEKNKIRAVVGQGFMQCGMPMQLQTTAQQTIVPGRPIMKGIGNVPVNNQTRPPVSLQQQSVKPDPLSHQRAIVGMNTGTTALDLNKLLQQQRQLSSSPNPLGRPMGNVPPVNSAPPFGGIPITGRIPVGSNPVVSPPGAVRAVAANALLMQQMMQGVSPTVRANTLNQLNQLNQLSQLNQLAALHAQQRMLDPRVQGMPRGVYPGVPPPLLSPRGNVTAPSNHNFGTPSNPNIVNAALNRALSPQTPSYKPSMNGPISPGFQCPTSVMNGNFQGNSNLMKWFGGDMLKTPLPSMPPVASPGQKVMTVDEIERCQQQTVTN